MTTSPTVFLPVVRPGDDLDVIASQVYVTSLAAQDALLALACDLDPELAVVLDGFEGTPLERLRGAYRAGHTGLACEIHELDVIGSG